MAIDGNRKETSKLSVISNFFLFASLLLFCSRLSSSMNFLLSLLLVISTCDFEMFQDISRYFLQMLDDHFNWSNLQRCFYEKSSASGNVFDEVTLIIKKV